MTPSVSIDATIANAKQYHASGQFAEAISLYEQLRLQLPADQQPAIDCNLGDALTHVGKIDDAVAAYRRAIAARPDVAAPLNNLANLLKEVGNLDEAIALFDRALEIEPRDAIVVNNRAAALEIAGRIDDAIAGYERAVELAPNVPNPFSNLIYAMHFSPRFDARALLVGRRSYQPENPQR